MLWPARSSTLTRSFHVTHLWDAPWWRACRSLYQSKRLSALYTPSECPSFTPLTMKTFLITCISFWLTGITEAQILGPDPPATGTWTDVHAAQLIERLRQPPPPPAGGFWVVEDHVGRKGPAIVRYYTDDKREIQADTLKRKRVNIKNTAMVFWLNERLSQALSAQVKPALAMHR